MDLEVVDSGASAAAPASTSRAGAPHAQSTSPPGARQGCAPPAGSGCSYSRPFSAGLTERGGTTRGARGACRLLPFSLREGEVQAALGFMVCYGEQGDHLEVRRVLHGQRDIAAWMRE